MTIRSLVFNDNTCILGQSSLLYKAKYDGTDKGGTQNLALVIAEALPPGHLPVFKMQELWK